MTEWNSFWSMRKNGFGKIITFVRHHFVTKSMVNFLLNNTTKGTLVEAGCGEGEVSINIALSRGDKIVLVDFSEKALETAEKKIKPLNVEAILLKTNILDMSKLLTDIKNKTVFNIGVIEHFTDCSEILREMVLSSDKYAIALIPENSFFWKIYIWLAFKTSMVPKDFLVFLYNETQLRKIIENASLNVLWIKRIRVLGIIPYLGICFNNKKG